MRNYIQAKILRQESMTYWLILIITSQQFVNTFLLGLGQIHIWPDTGYSADFKYLDIRPNHNCNIR